MSPSGVKIRLSVTFSSFDACFSFGKTDPEQLLPAPAKAFQRGPRPIAPPDLLATFLFAFGIPPREHLRDGEVVPELLRQS